MEYNGMTLKELLNWLADVIFTETQKPMNEINTDLIEECEALIAELSGNAEYFSSDNVRGAVEAILGKRDNN